MKIELTNISIRDLVDSYTNNDEEGVYAYAGELNIRPKYQREFVYKDKQRDAVIETIRKGFPLNTMYWVKNEEGYEVLDGQQRLLSICMYANKDFSIDFRYYHNLTEDEKEQFLDYSLMVYICEGTDKERLDWFRIINIAGEKLTEQELRNSTFTGTWLIDAKRYFSKTGCPASDLGSKYLKGSSIRQDYLEKVLLWISAKNGKQIDDYMAEHQHDPQATELWLYFLTVLEWVKATFPLYRNEMKGLDWGLFYNKFGTKIYNPKSFEERIIELMEDEDVTKKPGIYEYLFDGDERHLSIRTFSPRITRAAYEQQKGICPKCKEHFDIKEMQADHITPWSKGGKTVPGNCQMLCADCNRRKSNV